MLNILTTPGVHSLVSWGGRPADIPEYEIEAVRRLVESPLRIQKHPFIKCGDRVRIKSGPLEGIEGILVRNKSAYRLVLSVEMLARSAAVEVDVNMVERVPESESIRKHELRNSARVALVEPFGPTGA
jgi:transcription antitermination factor NusG